MTELRERLTALLRAQGYHPLKIPDPRGLAEAQRRFEEAHAGAPYDEVSVPGLDAPVRLHRREWQ